MVSVKNDTIKTVNRW